jgi:RNA polymerase sigma-70 factor (ECF subfamily)
LDRSRQSEQPGITEGNRERAALKDFRGTLRAAKKGDDEAFASIWREFHPGLVRYLRVKAASDAEDLAADTWCRAIRALRSFEGDEDGFRAWLYASARNRLIDWQRGSHKRFLSIDNAKLLMMPSARTVESEVEENSATEEALALIALLPPDQAEAVMLRTVAGLDVSAVAEIMRRTPGSVRVLCHRGLRRLEDMLASDAASGGSAGGDAASTEVAHDPRPPVGTGTTTRSSRLPAVHHG